MKPRELFIEAAKAASPFDDTFLERQRREEATEAFRSRTTQLMDKAQKLGPSLSQMNAEYLEEIFTKQDGDLEVRVTKRLINFECDAGDEFDDLVESHEPVQKRIIIGVHDLVTRVGHSDWQPRSSSRSCDVITELHVQEVDQLFNPFEEFQILERLNWQHPVFEEGDDSLSGLSYLNEDTVAKAKVRAGDVGWESVLGGMHASLDDLEKVLGRH